MRVVAASIPGLPTFWELSAPREWQRIDFISDLHLTADMPQTFEAWAAYLLATPADAVFILGDLFEVWVGDDARHAGFEARCAAVLAEAAARRTLAFMRGNRDFLVGAELLRDCGVHELEDPTVLLAFGQRLLLSHGDVTPDNVGRSHRREDFPTLSLLWQHHRRPAAPGSDGLVITVENAWGRFVYESTPLAPLGDGAAPMLHVGIRQQEPYGLGLRRAIDALPLSPAQREVCALLHAGRSTSDIAASLSISPSTVTDHVKKIYARLDVHSVHELSARIHRQVMTQSA